MTRMSMDARRTCALLLTVGTGDRNRQEETLFKPLARSISRGEWSLIVLLPSQETAPMADEFAQRAKGIEVICNPLPEPQLEEDADQCFGHFDTVICELLAGQHDADSIVIDITRGTKAMSAALLLAGATHGIKQVRYVSGKRDPRGTVIPGAEVVRQVPAQLIGIRRLHEQAEQLMLQGNFASVVSLVEGVDLDAGGSSRLAVICDDLRQLVIIADVYKAWDRFDYSWAYANLTSNPQIVGAAYRFSLSANVEGWLRTLSKRYDRKRPREFADFVALLMIDMFANAERRERDGLVEDAFIRYYRVLEMIGQYLLLERGYDTASLSPDCPEVTKFVQHLGSGQLKPDKNGNYKLGRFHAARFLKSLEGGSRDGFGYELIQLGEKHNGFLTKHRNKSILVHGFHAAQESTSGKSTVGDLRDLLLRVVPTARERLEIARSLDLRNR